MASFMGLLLLGSEYLLMKSWRRISESLKSEGSWSLACLCTNWRVSLKSSCHQMNLLKSALSHSVTRVLEEILVLLGELLSPQPAVLVEQVDLGDLLLVVAISAEAYP